jgi:hypothetical protein
MAQQMRDDPWHYNATDDNYVHMVTGEKLSPSQHAARTGQSAGIKASPSEWTPPPPPLPLGVAMVKLPDVLKALEEIGGTYYVQDDNVKRYAAHVAERLRGMVNVRDPKELLR